MERAVFLGWTTIVQCGLFLAASLIIYAWVEHNAFARTAGQVLFILLGLFSLWAVWVHGIPVPEEPGPGAETPVELRLLAFFYVLSAAGLSGLAALFLDRLHKTFWAKLTRIILVCLALVLFFWINKLRLL